MVLISIQKPYQINVYKAGKRLSIMQSPVDWREICQETVKQINF